MCSWYFVDDQRSLVAVAERNVPTALAHHTSCLSRRTSNGSVVAAPLLSRCLSEMIVHALLIHIWKWWCHVLVVPPGVVWFGLGGFWLWTVEVISRRHFVLHGSFLDRRGWGWINTCVVIILVDGLCSEHTTNGQLLTRSDEHQPGAWGYWCWVGNVDSDRESRIEDYS